MTTSDALLDVKGLQAWYGDSHVLHGVDLKIHKGQTVTILGRNGAGKTTTLKTIMGLVRKRKGIIQFKGADIIDVPLHDVARRGMGFVPEERGIFSSLTVWENLLLPPRVSDGGFTLDEIHELFPNLAERRSSQGTKLSGGEQQMLAMARILRTGANLLLLDEPTEGLAPVIVKRIGAVIHKLRERGMTVLLVEQNFRFSRKVSDYYYVMESGQIIDHFSESERPSRMDRLQKTLGV
jgi:branched-chain amino acid transport system ATP-binding protein